MKLSIGSDHAGFELKSELINYLENLNHEVIDVGPSNNNRVDYPDYAHKLVNSILKNESELGILICGSGNGISMTANKHKNIRAALCWNSEIATLARNHNDANIVSLPARFISFNEAKSIINSFLASSFEGGRHLNRVNKINCD
jgi:ribose 5-phosphate isomerase B